ncbi:oxidoreductase [Sphingobium jiangsuense]|uniref:Putative oxidoreductase n=1 Tax=Sphingobium jiangsuense TaxID=870476 RepID=A0A7W6BJN1_9SPHN|nr:SDR family NAD(P)-dependent oxidoreductase [Sphingobium jiangsuense]MBB3928250.1 putative oxidoreductase [Sphingobium jiangsuense]GLS99374.1 oxidoreductase [Sphingobium jiangsuense]
MELTGNTVLITGGNSGIGYGLAVALHEAGNKVIIAGRRADALARVAGAHPGMSWHVVDMGDAASIAAFADEVKRRYPDLNVLVNNAGIMRVENLLEEPCDLSGAEEQVAINLLGPIRLAAALLPHLRKQPRGAIINVSSGLAFVPFNMVPTYCATKAAIHSYTRSLRRQLAGTALQVIELAPPAVATNLMPVDENGPPTLPLDDFIGEVMAILRDQPDVEEILVDAVKPLREAEATGQFGQLYELINAAPQH